MRRRIRFRSLRSRIVAWSFVPAAIILIAVALVTFYAYQQVAEDLVVERNRDLARLSAGQLADELAEYPALLAEWAQTAGVYARSPTAAQTALRRARNRFVVFDGGVFLLDWRGVVVAAEPQHPDLVGQDWSEQTFFREAALTRRPALSGVITASLGLDELGPAAGGSSPAIVVAAPILAGPVDLQGVVAGTFRLGATALSSFYGSIVKLHIGGNDTVYLVDDDGRVIYHPDPERIGESFATQTAVQQVLTGNAGAFRTQNWNGQEIVASFAPVPGTSWGLVVEADWNALLQASGGYRHLLLTLLVLGVVLPAIVVAVGVRRITRPIADLMVAAQEVAAGNLGRTVVATTGDELEELVKQFNRMSGQLAASYSALQAREERLALVLEATNDGIWDWDLDRDEMYYSPRWKEMLGYEDCDIANSYASWCQLIHPDDLEWAEAKVQADLAGQTPSFVLEHRLRHKDGSYRWILARGTTLRDATGHPYRMIGSHTDITARKQAAQALEWRLAFEKTISDISTEFINLSPDEIDPGIQRTLAAIGALTGSDRSYVFCFSADGTVMDNTHEWHRDGIPSLQAQYRDQPTSILPWFIGAVQRLETVHIPSFDDVLPPGALADRECCLAHDPPTRSVLNVPMIYQGKAIGLLGLDAVRAEKTWDDDSIALLRFVGEIVSNALEHKRAQEALRLAYQTLEQRVEKRTHELATLNAISAVVSRSLDLHDILRDALQQTIDSLEMDVGVAYRLAGDPAGDDELFLEPLVWHCATPDSVLCGSAIAVQGSPYELAASSGQPLVWEPETTDLDAAVAGALQQEQLRQVVSVPLVARGKWVGAFNMGAGRVRTFTPEQMALLAAVGQQVGVAMENARLYEAERAGHAEAERRHQVAKGMRDIMNILNSNRSPREILDYIVQQASRLLAADAGLIARFEPDGKWRTFAASPAWPADLADVDGGVLANTAGNRRLLNRQSLGIGDLRAYVQAEMERLGETLPPGALTWYARMSRHFGAVLAAPLLVKDTLYGVMALYYGEARVFDEEDYRLGMTLADQIALALENAQLREQAEQAAASAERSRLARELHDSVTQNLYCLTLYSEAAARQLLAGENETAAQYLRDLRDTAQEALREMRLLIFELRPPALEKSGLVGALQSRLDAVEKRGGLQVELGVTGVEGLAGEEWLPLAVQQELYYVAQEALNNSLKHARAQRVRVCLSVSPEVVRLEVADDGVGFGPAAAAERGGLGLAGMHERVQRIAGQLCIDSAPGQGTHILVTVARQG